MRTLQTLHSNTLALNIFNTLSATPCCVGKIKRPRKEDGKRTSSAALQVLRIELYASSFMHKPKLGSYTESAIFISSLDCSIFFSQWKALQFPAEPRPQLHEHDTTCLFAGLQTACRCCDSKTSLFMMKRL